MLGFGISMVEILCPHCEGELELDDDASGEFECPLCDGKFEWNVEEEGSFDDAEIHTENRIVHSHGFNKMEAAAEVAATVVAGGIKAYLAIVVLLGVIFLIFFVILILFFLVSGPVR